jgi:hypothetical protein
VLVFTHVTDDRALGAQHTAGWVVYLNRLDSHLAGNFLSEQEAHEASPSCTSATPRASGWSLTSAGRRSASTPGTSDLAPADPRAGHSYARRFVDPSS